MKTELFTWVYEFIQGNSNTPHKLFQIHYSSMQSDTHGTNEPLHWTLFIIAKQYFGLQ